MDRASAVNLIRDTFESSFDRDKFAKFTKNLLKSYDDSRAFVRQGAYVKEAFKPIISHYERLGVFTSSEGERIDILVVYLQKESSLYNARSAQRNFLRWYIKEGNNASEKDAVLAAVVSPDKEDWRFSFVKMEYSIGATPSGSISAMEELTPAKRYSFIVGKNERSHTAQQSLVPLLEQDKRTPTLADLEQVFNIETVAKEFFEKYKELFLIVQECLDDLKGKDAAIRADFEAKGVNTADFAKKLLGQIVFLYFLQKKGWFGVPRGARWGDGPKGFIRSLFTKEVSQGRNFFNDILEPLFYEALAVERTDDFYSRFDCKIPFLNGGLFDPINGYDWINTDIIIPDHLFSNQNKTKDGDEGDGILDIFDRYNFTVCEDEPLEKEVAVDPEMLGKVFENLLEVRDRKSKGTYYTPREIVHYMCQESLINYLTTELPSISKPDIEVLVKHGDTAIENDLAAAICEEKGTDTYTYRLPESVRRNAREIDKKLASIRVCDPAVGSGAFLVGMMNEITRTRRALATPAGTFHSVYQLKRNAIHNSLYGVDIDPGAVEIAKLRLWLSLVVDEEDRATIKPLPNLDYKIMQGNSLLEEYEGIKLFDDSILTSSGSPEEEMRILEARQSRIGKQYCDLRISGKPDKIRQTELERDLKAIADSLKRLNAPKSEDNQSGLFDKAGQAKEKAEKLKNLHKQYFNTSLKSIKDDLKSQIQALEWDLIEATLREQDKSAALERVRHLKDANVRPFFLWRLHFSEVFEEKGGFDVVIGNPPYGYIFQDKSVFDLINRLYVSAEYKIDAYTVFTERGLSLARRSGLACFIMPHTFLSGKYFRKFRILLGERDLRNIVVLGKKMFEAAEVDTCVLLIGNDEAGSHINLADFRNGDSSLANEFKTYTVDRRLVFSACSDVLLIGTPQQIATYAKINKSGVVLESIGNLYHGVQSRGDDKAITYEKSSDCLPLLKGRDFNKYICRPEVKYFIYKPENIKSGGDLRFHLVPSKIVMRTTADRIIAAIDNAAHLVLNSVNILVLRNDGYSLEYVLAILNSKLMEFWYHMTVQEPGKTFAEVKIAYIQRIPVVQPEPIVRKAFDAVVRCLMTSKYCLTEQTSLFFEHLVDAMVYDLYFHEEITATDCEVLKHLTVLPELGEDWSDQQNLQTTENVCRELSDPKHPIGAAMSQMQSIEDIRIIECMQ